MSCAGCIKNSKPACDPDLNECGGYASFRANWEPDEIEEPEIEDVFAQMKIFKPEESN